jgi:hypothetical protein
LVNPPSNPQIADGEKAEALKIKNSTARTKEQTDERAATVWRQRDVMAEELEVLKTTAYKAAEKARVWEDRYARVEYDLEQKREVLQAAVVAEHTAEVTNNRATRAFKDEFNKHG